MKELVLRFLIGGVIVSAFSVLGEMLRPKSFAGLFGAAPSYSVLLASLVWLVLSAAFWWLRKSRILRRARLHSAV